MRRQGIVVGPGSGSGTVVRGHFPLRFLRATHGHARLLDGFEPPVAHQVGQRAFVHQRERLRGARHDAPRAAGHLRAQVARDHRRIAACLLLPQEPRRTRGRRAAVRRGLGRRVGGGRRVHGAERAGERAQKAAGAEFLVDVHVVAPKRDGLFGAHGHAGRAFALVARHGGRHRARLGEREARGGPHPSFAVAFAARHEAGAASDAARRIADDEAVHTSVSSSPTW